MCLVNPLKTEPRVVRSVLAAKQWANSTGLVQSFVRSFACHSKFSRPAMLVRSTSFSLLSSSIRTLSFSHVEVDSLCVWALWLVSVFFILHILLLLLLRFLLLWSADKEWNETLYMKMRNKRSVMVPTWRNISDIGNRDTPQGCSAHSSQALGSEKDAQNSWKQIVRVGTAT